MRIADDGRPRCEREDGDRSLPHNSRHQPLSNVNATATEDRVLDAENDHGAQDGDEHAPDVEAINARGAEGIEDESTDDSAYDPENDVEDDAFSRLVHDLAGDEARNESQDDPGDD
jgi:hypothetical protein